MFIQWVLVLKIVDAHVIMMNVYAINNECLY